MMSVLFFTQEKKKKKKKKRGRGEGFKMLWPTVLIKDAKRFSTWSGLETRGKLSSDTEGRGRWITALKRLSLVGSLHLFPLLTYFCLSEVSRATLRQMWLSVLR